jgi:hypothetical protein
MRLYYRIKNWLLKRKPYFSMIKYMKYIEKIKNPRMINEDGLDEREKVLLDYVQGNRDVWWIAIDGMELTQLTSYSFTVKNKEDNKRYSISKVWVEWKKIK